MKNNAEAIKFSKYISDYLYNYAPAFLSRSKDTLKSYEDTLVLYVKFLEKEGITSSNLSRKAFERTYIEKWILWLKNERSCSPDTCNNRMSTFRGFLKYLGSKDIKLMYLYEESRTIHRLKTLKKKVTGVSKKGIQELLNQPDLGTKIGRRDYTLLMLMYSSAARINEILSLRIKDLFLEGPHPYMNLFGKGEKIRPAFLMPRTVTNLKGYIESVHGKNPKPEDYLFFSPVGNLKEKLTQPAIAKRIKKYAVAGSAKCLEIPRNLHSHQLRHAKASHWLEDGMNIVQIKFLLGHESVETTMKYLDVSIAEKAEALATLEDEKEAALPKKWEMDDGSLSEFLGLPR